MHLEERTVGEVTIVKVTGDITLSSGGDVMLKDKVQSLLQQGKKKLLLDLGSVAYVDSGGLGQLVQCSVTATKNGGKLKLLSMTKRLNDLLVLTKLATIFDSHDDEAAAVASF
jgi:anti-sigma B factor antagonist